jgi:uncharacterized protein (TIGR03382 family)
MRPNRSPRVVALLGALGCVFLGRAGVEHWESVAAASTSFPAAVDQHLNLTGGNTIEAKVAPPDGCLLCHMTESGGFDTNNAFGSELREHGAVGTETGTVGPALDAVEADDPHAIDDIRMGINPNNDTSTPIQALPQPGYGCSTGSSNPRDVDATAALAAAALAAILVVNRRRPRAQRSQ